MKTKILSGIFTLFVISAALGQGTAFTYQGRLNDGGNPAHGSYDFRFKLFLDPDGNTQAGSTFLTNGISVTNGLIFTTLDFGASLFNGSNYWLEVDVRTNGGGGYSNLNPLQPLLPTPYAMFANTASNLSGTIGSSGISGTYGSAVVFNNAGNNFGGTFSGNGANITNVNAAMLNGLRASNFWNTAGNSGTTAGPNFVGTTDNQPLELRVNNQRALRLVPDGSTNNAPTVIGGSPVNVVAPGVVGATIAGGGGIIYGGFPATNAALGEFNTIGGGWGNTTGSTNFDVSEATVAGGGGNTASGISSFIGGGAFNLTYNNNATVAGGLQNRAGFHDGVVGGTQNSADGIEGTIGGGRQNVVQTNTVLSVVAGGYGNQVQGNNYEAGGTIGGGGLNTIQPSGVVDGQNPYTGFASSYSSIGGGFFNQIQTGSAYATIAGGRGNTIFSNSVRTTIGGGFNNSIQTNSSGASIAGGIANSIQGLAFDSTIGGGQNNVIQSGATYANIAGGFGNSVQSFAGAIGGGYQNTNSGGYASIAGGYQNVASGAGSFVGGGGFDNGGFAGNLASGNASVVAGGFGNSATMGYASIGGGYFNLATNGFATVGGGRQNIAGGNWSTVPGGYDNIASGQYSFAAGNNARAVHDGSFVWADSSGVVYSSDRNNQFKVRAGGGVEFDVSGSTGLNPPALYVNSTSGNGVGFYVTETSTDAGFVVNNAGTGSIIKGFNGGGSPAFEVVHDGTVFSKGVALTSDRNAKENFASIHSGEVLQKVASLSISQWNYKTDQRGVAHLGPTAQDFHAAFGLNGDDDKHISVVDEGGVALAAIQGLNQKLEEKDAQIRELQQSVAELKELVSQLAKTKTP